jgi:outer membrane immunogenic protein
MCFLGHTCQFSRQSFCDQSCVDEIYQLRLSKLFTSKETRMKKLALGLLLASIAGAASAADLSAPRATPYTKAPVVSPVTNWSGFYIGAMGGYASESTSDPLPLKGGFGGGTVGYNWQFGTFVLGIEGDGAFGDVSNTATASGIILADKIQALATVRGRFGVAVDQVLLYGTGGLALADEKFSATTLGVTLSDTQTRTGWTAGAGIEWMFIPRWSLKAEYLYRRFDSVTALGSPTGTTAVNSGQFGINYHF